MSPRLKISNCVIERIKNVSNGCQGRLYGITVENSVVVVGLDLSAVEVTQKCNDSQNILELGAIQNLPGGVNLCGAFVADNRKQLNDVGVGVLENVSNENPVVFNWDVTSKKLTSAFYNNGKTEKVDFVAVNNNELVKSFVYFRLQASFPLSSDVNSACMESTLNDLEKRILSGSPAFHFEDSNIYILGNKGEISGLKPTSTVKELLSAITKENKTNKNEENVVVNVEMFMNRTINEDSPQTAPFIKYEKKSFKHCELEFCLDSLTMAAQSLPVDQLYKPLLDGLHRTFILNKENLLRQLEKGKIYDICSPETYHFFPKALGHFVTIVYGPKQSVDDLKGVRESFHSLLLLPMDRPLFRQANAHDFSNSSNCSTNLLLNPHESLTKSGVQGGEPCFVQGTYAYHHYMQDGMDDNGWGCAYRSLQTIFSWFRHQGYTNMAVPFHKDIQQCLVNIGDKQRSFVGSRQWIGSTEVSFVLDTLLGVSSRIVNVSSGEEMTMKGGELSHHFKTQGTPIMIGGGVLAHTIIGVDYNKNTGEIKFLILDPHYTGGEDLGVILKKGWCGWKGPDFWKKDAFYNMCLPLKPKCV
ncbi:hypothetical protein RUM43_006462 [Polyplax serrata]|uniref:Probable Ufm1-specific protease 2 n=1 Tax=Polyplax serrata TaxID=468196 RepID=A0AAN8RVF4_POLSC